MSISNNSTRLSPEQMVWRWRAYLSGPVVIPLILHAVVFSKGGPLGDLGDWTDYLVLIGVGLLAISVVVSMWYRKHAAPWLDKLRAPDEEQYRRLYTKWLIGITIADLPAILGIVHFMYTANSWPMLVLSAASFVLICLYKPSFRAPIQNT